jgi:hypothetical protein
MRHSGPVKKALVPALALMAALLAGCAPTAPVAEPTVTPAETPSTEPTPTETPEPVGNVPDGALENIHDALDSGNTAAIEGYLAPSVHLVLAGSEYGGDVTDHSQVIDDLTGFTGDGITWDFDLPADLIENYRNNPGAAGAYTDFFPEDAVVGKSSDDGVLSFTFTDGLITQILMATEYALIFE